MNLSKVFWCTCALVTVFSNSAQNLEWGNSIIGDGVTIGNNITMDGNKFG